MNIAAILFVVIAAVQAQAQAVRKPLVKPETLQALEAAAGDVQIAEDTFDGQPIIGRAAGGLVLLKEEKDILLDTRVISGHPARGSHAVGRNGDSFDTYEPAEPNRRVSVYGDRRTYGIENRGDYVGRKMGKGGMWGAIAGTAAGVGLAIALAATQVTPVGWAILAGVGVAALVGAIAMGIGALIGALKSKVFTEDVVTRTEDKR